MGKGSDSSSAFGENSLAKGLNDQSGCEGFGAILPFICVFFLAKC